MQMMMPYPYIVGVQRFLHAHIMDSAKASRQNDRNAVLTGCPILLQFWSYERIAIGRPMIDQSPYTSDMYGDTEDDRPTMGTLWYSRQVWTR